VALALEEAALAELRERRPDRVLETNVEFWAAIVLDFAEVPPQMFTSIFSCARTGGWSAHILEEKRTGRLIRPSADYVGPGSRPASTIEGWDQSWATPRSKERCHEVQPAGAKRGRGVAGLPRHDELRAHHRRGCLAPDPRHSTERRHQLPGHRERLRL
jgi:hypothetical protein